MGVDICVLLLPGRNGFLCPLSSDTDLSLGRMWPEPPRGSAAAAEPVGLLSET